MDYEPLPSVTDTGTASQPGSPPVWDECPDNVSNLHELGDKAATDAAFAAAAHRVRRRYVITRVHAQYMEPRGALGVYDPGEDRYTLYADVQYPAPGAHRARHQHLQDPGAPDPGHRGRRRRRVRHQGLAVRRAPAGALGRAEGRAPGQVAVRAPRGDPRRRARTRQRERRRAGARRAGPLPRPAGADLRQRGRLRLLRPQPARHVQQRRDPGRGLHLPRRARGGPLGADQHQRDRALSRRGPAGGDLRHRASDRRRGPRARAWIASRSGVRT